MSLDDTDKWASRIIDEICEESKAFAKILKPACTKDKEVGDENNYPKISHQDNNLNSRVFTSSEVQQSDLLCLTSNDDVKKLDEFNEAYNDPVSKTSKDQAVTNIQASCDLKMNFNLVQETEENKMVNDCVGKAIEEEINYNPTSDVITKSTNEEIMSMNFDTDFLEKIETDSTKPYNSRKKLSSVSFEKDNFCENSQGNLDVLHSSSFIEPFYENDEKNNDSFWKMDDESFANSFEIKLSSFNATVIFGGQVGDNHSSLDQSPVEHEFKSDDALSRNVDENVNIISFIEKERKIRGLQNKNFVNREKSMSDTCLNRDCHSFSGSNPKMLSKISSKTNHQSLDNIRGKIVTEIQEYSDEFSIHEVNNCNKSEALKLNCNKIISITRAKNEQVKDELNEDVQEIYNEKLKVRNEKISFVVSLYRSICATCETIFIRPLANIFVDYFDFITFIFFLSLCVLYMLYQKIRYIISNYKILIFEKSSNRHHDGKGKMLLHIGKDLPPVSKVMFIDENASPAGQTTIENLSFQKDKSVKRRDGKLIELVYPHEVAAIPLNYEIVTEKMKEKIYERVRNVSTFIDRKSQHRATEKRNECCVVNIRIISNTEDEKYVLLHENDFDPEIVASSKKRYFNVGETCSWGKYDNLHKLQKISKCQQGDSEIMPIIKTNSDRSLTEMFSSTCDFDEKPLLNSTEVDRLENPSYFTALSSSEIWYFERDFKLQNSPESKEENYSSASLNVNLPSFASRSDFVSDSILKTLECFHNDESEETADDVKILGEVTKEIDCLTLSSSSLDKFTNVDSQKEITREVFSEGNLKEIDSKSSESYFDEKLKHINLDIKTERSEIPQTSNITDLDFLKNDVLMRGDAENVCGPSNSNNQYDLQMEEALIPTKVKDNPKRKKGIRRRMSSLMNNWRNMQMVPCVVKNIKIKKN